MSALRVLLVNPPRLLPAAAVDHPFGLNLGALQHAAVLRERGHSVRIADACSNAASDVRRVDAGIRIGCAPEALLADLADPCFDAVAVCIGQHPAPAQRDPAVAETLSLLSRRLPGVPLLAFDGWFGASAFVDVPDREFFAAYPEVSHRIRGESDLTLATALESLGQHEYERGTSVEGSPPAQLDELPPANWTTIDVAAFLGFVERFSLSSGGAECAAAVGYLPLAASRRAPATCPYCSDQNDSSAGPRRRHSIAYVRAQMESLRTLGARGIVMLDPAPNEGLFEELLEILESLQLGAAFVNPLDASLLQRQHVATLRRLTPTITVTPRRHHRGSASDDGLDLGPIERVASWCRDATLPLRIAYPLGMHEQTMAQANALLSHARRMAEDNGARPLLSSLGPFAGARLHGECLSRRFSPPPRAHVPPTHGGADPPADALATAVSLLETRLAALSPRKLIVNLTYVCNNRCEMCAVGGRRALHMDSERCARLLAEYFARGARLLDYDGGEPTLHPDLLRLVSVAREIGFERVNVTTNGRRLSSREFASRLLLSGIDSLLISLYAPTAECHESMSGTPGSFAETVAGISHAVRLKPKRVELGINTLLGRSNWHALRGLASFVADLGVRRLNVQFPTPFGRATSAHVPPWAEALREVQATLDELGQRLEIRVVNLPPCLLPGHEAAALADAEKYSRVMAFVDTPPENLASYLSRRRARRPECAACAYFIVCEGHYEFDARSDESASQPGAGGP